MQADYGVVTILSFYSCWKSCL